MNVPTAGDPTARSMLRCRTRQESIGTALILPLRPHVSTLDPNCNVRSLAMSASAMAHSATGSPHAAERNAGPTTEGNPVLRSAASVGVDGPAAFGAKVRCQGEQEPSMNEITRVAIDTSKSLFTLHGTDADGRALLSSAPALDRRLAGDSDLRRRGGLVRPRRGGCLAAGGRTIVLMIDQTQATERHQVDGGGSRRRPGAAAGLAGERDPRGDRLRRTASGAGCRRRHVARGDPAGADGRSLLRQPRADRLVPEPRLGLATAAETGPAGVRRRRRNHARRVFPPQRASG